MSSAPVRRTMLNKPRRRYSIEEFLRFTNDNARMVGSLPDFAILSVMCLSPFLYDTRLPGRGHMRLTL
jgi:hypothetical protein